MRILIDNETVTTKSGTAKASGKPYSIREQTGYVDKGERYPEKIKIQLEGEAKPFKPGEYELDIDASCYVGRFDSLELSTALKLVPISKTAAAVAAKTGT
jgi:hypothetical protein